MESGIVSKAECITISDIRLCWVERDECFYHQFVFACSGAGAGKGDHWELCLFACEVMYILGGDPDPSIS